MLCGQLDDLRTICNHEPIRQNHETPAGLARKCSKGGVNFSRVVNGRLDYLH
jgi:hypothetical protein